jgi:hypothetical protein
VKNVLDCDLNLGFHTPHARVLTKRPLQTATGPNPSLVVANQLWLNNLIFLITNRMWPEPSFPLSFCNGLVVRVLVVCGVECLRSDESQTQTFFTQEGTKFQWKIIEKLMKIHRLISTDIKWYMTFTPAHQLQIYHLPFNKDFYQYIQLASSCLSSLQSHST